MLKTTLLTCLAGIATATARTWCLGFKDGVKLASRYADLISGFTPDKARTVLAADFTEVSDSANAVAGKPLGAVTYDSREAFIEGQAAQRAVDMDVLAVDAVTCDRVVVRWMQWFDAPVMGISVLEAVVADDDWRIRRIWMEFNGLALVE